YGYLLAVGFANIILIELIVRKKRRSTIKFTIRIVYGVLKAIDPLCFLFIAFFEQLLLDVVQRFSKTNGILCRSIDRILEPVGAGAAGETSFGLENGESILGRAPLFSMKMKTDDIAPFG